MVKKLLAGLMVLGMVATAQAVVTPDDRLELVIDPTTGEATIVATGNFTTQANLESVLVQSPDEGLIDVGAWTSISDQAAALWTETGGAGGGDTGWFGFGESETLNANTVGDLTSAAGGIVGPGAITEISYGQIVPGITPSNNDIRFQYVLDDTPGGDAYLGQVTLIPEPASIALLGLGGLLIARRRRA